MPLGITSARPRSRFSTVARIRSGREHYPATVSPTSEAEASLYQQGQQPLSLFFFFSNLRSSMAKLQLVPLLLMFLLGNAVTNNVSAATFTLLNRCTYTIWPGTLSGNGVSNLGGGGFTLPAGASMSLTAPISWSGRFWARTGCNFDNSGAGNCSTGDCGNLQCTGGGAPPVTLAEFTLGDKDFYDVSLVDGYNVGMGVRPIGGTGDCQYAGCLADLRQSCPEDLMVTENGEVVACKSACSAFDSPEFCCTGDHSTPETCPPTRYSEMFKNACPRAYSYAYDDASSTCTCSGSDYVITFCPTGP